MQFVRARHGTPNLPKMDKFRTPQGSGFTLDVGARDNMPSFVRSPTHPSKTPRTLLPHNNKHDTLVVDRPVHGHSVCALQGHLAHLKGRAPVGGRCFEFASTLALDLLLEDAAHDLIKGSKGAKGRLDDR